jgi:hypothetical protein
VADKRGLAISSTAYKTLIEGTAIKIRINPGTPVQIVSIFSCLIKNRFIFSWKNVR